MIDTVKIKFQEKLTREQLSCYTKTTIELPNKNKKIINYRNETLDSFDGSGKFMLKCEYFHWDYNGNPLICLEFSVPRACYGDNFHLITDIHSAIEKVNPIINKLTFLPKLDVGEGVLIRVDFIYDHHVGDNIDYYLQAFGKINYPHRSNTVYDHHNVVYFSKNDKTTFYDKQKESNNEDAMGFIRQETRLRTKKVFKTRLEMGRVRLKDLTIGMASKVLKQDLERLKIEDCCITGHHIALKTLLKLYPGVKGWNLYNFCRMRTEYSEKSLIDMGCFSKDTCYKYKRALREAGITPALLDEERKLPPLTIDWRKCMN